MRVIFFFTYFQNWFFVSNLLPM